MTKATNEFFLRIRLFTEPGQEPVASVALIEQTGVTQSGCLVGVIHPERAERELLPYQAPQVPTPEAHAADEPPSLPFGES